HVRGEIDDMAALALPHVREHRLDQVKWAAQVDAKDALPVLARKLGAPGGGDGDPGVVDEDVDPPERGEGGLHEPPALLGDADVSLEALCLTAVGRDLLHHLAGFTVAGAVAHAHPEACPGERPRDGPPDAPRGSGDERDLACVSHGSILL